MQVQQATLFSFFAPAVAVSVAIEEDAPVRRQLAANQRGQRRFKIFRLLQLIGERHQRIRHGGVDHDVGACDVERRTRHAELELVASEGKRRGAVAVGVILRDGGQRRNADIHAPLAGRPVVGTADERVDHSSQLVAHIHGDDCGRRFVCAQTVIVARTGHADAQQILILIDRLDDRRQKEQELRVFHRGRTRVQQVFALVGDDRPVVVLARAVDAFKRLFVQQAHKPVPVGHLLHDLHGQLVVIRGDVGRGIDRRHLVLAGGNLVVLRLGADAHLPQLFIQLRHIRLHARADRTEVVVLHLLALGRLGAKERAAGDDQIRPLLVIGLVDQEILLLRAHGRRHAGDMLAKEPEHPARLTADGVHRAQQRRLLVENLAGVGAKRRGDAQRVILNERIAGRVPRGVAARLERGPQSAGGEGRCVRLALDELFAGKLHDDRAIGTGRDKGVVFFGGDAGHRLEPVGVVRCALFNGPILHRIGDDPGDLRIQRGALADRLLERPVYILGHPFLHHHFIEYHASKKFWNARHEHLSPSAPQLRL